MAVVSAACDGRVVSYRGRTINPRPWNVREGVGVFAVWRPDEGEEEEDAVLILAVDAQDAAEHWAEYDDASSAEYAIVGGRAANVLVRRAGVTDARGNVCLEPGGEVTQFVVCGETLPSYTARKKEREDEARRE